MNTYRRKPDNLVYVELLDLPALWRWLRSMGSGRLYIFDITPAARLIVWILKIVFRVSIEALSFNIIDVRGSDGVSASANVRYHDLRQFREFLLPKVRTQQFWLEARSQGGMSVYLLKKAMCDYDLDDDRKYKQVWHVFMMLRILEWHRRSLGQQDLNNFMDYVEAIYG